MFPHELPCPECNTTLDIDALPIRPFDPSWDPTINAGRNPWLTQRSWFLRRWYDTLIMSCTRPGHLVRGTPPDAPLSAALAYLAISVVLGALIPALIHLLLENWLAIVLRPWPGFFATSAAMFLLVPIWAVAVHLLLLLFRVSTRGVSSTINAACYASGALALSAIPYIGPLVGPFAFGWIAARTTARAQDTRVTLTSWPWLAGAVLITLTFGLTI